MSSKMRLVYLDPHKIKIPPVRVHSIWDEEEYDVFKASIEASGIEQPVKCIKEGEEFWLEDGENRIKEAKMRGMPRIPVVYKEGTLVDAMCKNLFLNRLHGKTKASEEVQLIKHLYEKEGLDLGEISERTGIPPDLVEKRLAISKAEPYVQEMLDNEKIGVGIAFELSRLPTAAGQVRLLQELVKLPRLPATKEVAAIVDESLKIIAEREKAPETPTVGPPLRTIRCGLCEQRYSADEMRGVNLCPTCLGLAKDHIQELMKKRARGETPEQILAQKVAEAGHI